MNNATSTADGLSSDQIKDYERDGFLILRGAISEQEISRLEQGVSNNPPLDGTLDPNAPVYPAPGRYTLATNCLADKDLAFIVEHKTIVNGASQLLDDDPILTAYVIYDRTPEGAGLPVHHDYKRWRPVGSSMNWLFTIVPFCDFDSATGPLYVAPGSHHLERVHVKPGACAEVDPAMKPDASDFIDPQLKRGDLLFMNMHTWHKADANHSTRHRVGLFNKYAAASAPPATGYFVYNKAAQAALSPAGQNLLAVTSDTGIVSTRAVLVRYNSGQAEVYCHPGDNGIGFPGGAIWHERAIADWDLGNMIAPLQQHLREQVQIETPWLSYIGDYEEGQGLCRVYGFTLNDNGFPVNYPGNWLSVSELDAADLAQDWAADACKRWLDPHVNRGKGLSQAQCRIDQFAY